MTTRPIRVLIAKPGLDGHDRGARVIASMLRDAGLEVIYTGIRQTPAAIAEAAEQEDVDIVGLSVLSGSHVSLTRRVAAEMVGRGMTHVPIVVGGTIPRGDVAAVIEAGATAVFPTGSSFDEIISACRRLGASQSSLRR